MATFSHRIAAIRDNAAVGIHDFVTGVLRLSLSPADPIKALRGSPDGYLLFCVHQAPLLTFWDIHTGGLVHTFTLKQRSETIAVSSKDRYIAGGFSDGSVNIWEVANRMEITCIRGGLPVTHLYWLEPEQHLATTEGELVRIWDISAGTLLHRFKLDGTTFGAVYSQKLDFLAILTASNRWSTITVICPHTGSCSQHIVYHQLTRLTFSQTAQSSCAALGPLTYYSSTFRRRVRLISITQQQ